MDEFRMCFMLCWVEKAVLFGIGVVSDFLYSIFAKKKWLKKSKF
jgi:hypothetical protein